jgi:hypothetical protein
MYIFTFHSKFVQLRLDFVLQQYISSHTCKKVVVQANDFDENAQQTLVKTLLKVKESSNLLLHIAEEYLFDKPDGPLVPTNQLHSLLDYKVIDIECGDFLEKFYESFEQS